MFYTKKPIIIEAITFDELVDVGLHAYKRAGHPLSETNMPWSFSYKGHAITHENDDCYLIPTLEGTMKFNRGDRLVTGVQGEIYPCKLDIFNATYEPVSQKVPPLQDSAEPQPDLIAVEQERQTFAQELVSLINRHSIENMSNTPDWILGEYLLGCMKAFDLTMHLREEYYGRPSPLTGRRPPIEVNAVATPEEQPYDPLKEFERMRKDEPFKSQRVVTADGHTEDEAEAIGERSDPELAREIEEFLGIDPVIAVEDEPSTSPMTFSAALEAIKQGFYVRRSNWHDGKFITWLQPERPTRTDPLGQRGVDYITIHDNHGGSPVPWEENAEDILADDWHKAGKQ